MLEGAIQAALCDDSASGPLREALCLVELRTQGRGSGRLGVMVWCSICWQHVRVGCNARNTSAAQSCQAPPQARQPSLKVFRIPGTETQEMNSRITTMGCLEVFNRFPLIINDAPPHNKKSGGQKLCIIRVAFSF